MNTSYIVVAIVVIVGSAIMIVATRNLLNANKKRKSGKRGRRR